MYKLKYITYYNWAMYLEFVVLKSFIKHLRSGKQNQNKKTHGSISKHTRGVIPFIHHSTRRSRAIKTRSRAIKVS